MTNLEDPNDEFFTYLTGSFSEFNYKNCIKACKWSPDGTKLLVSSEDACLRLYDLNDVISTGQIPREIAGTVIKSYNQTIYDFCWIEGQSRFLCCGNKDPLKLYDSESKAIIGNYIFKFNSRGPHCCGCSAKSDFIVAGHPSLLVVYDIERLGTDFITSIPSQDHLKGIISTVCGNPVQNDLFAAGSFDRSIGLFSLKCPRPLQAIFDGNEGGVTHVCFSEDGMKLYSGDRGGNGIVCWDLRMVGRVLGTFGRVQCTKQRVYFDLYDGWLLSGDDLGRVVFWDGEGDCRWQEIHGDVVCGLSVNRAYRLMATGSGTRRFEPERFDNSVRIWRINF